VNDKTRTPDDPDGNGSVATGEQASDGTAPSDGASGRQASDGTGSAAGGTSPAAGPPAAGPPAAGAAASGPAAAAAAPEGATPPAGRVAARPAAARPAAAQSGQGGDPAAAGAPNAADRRSAERSTDPKSAQSRPSPAGADAPTTEMRLPSANGSPPRPAPGAPADVPVAAVPGTDDGTRPAPAPAPSGRPPAPSPGPVPGPGPAAAAPPPWHRVPGQESIDHREHPQAERPAGGLLDGDGPTNYLEAPGRPGPHEDAQPSEGGRWSAVRAVRNRPPRQAALQLKRLDPWSVLKLALVLAVVLFFIWLVAVGVLYGVLDGMGVWDRLNGTYADLVSGEVPSGSPLISAGRVFGLAAVIGAINSLLFAVAVTVGAFVYNVSADLVGGIEVTLSERD
jgi:hypothetical protein